MKKLPLPLTPRPRNLDEKIGAARRTGSRYTPTFGEWFGANKHQRNHMTWPQSVINAARREG